jgi:hypothetical protein
MGDSRWSEQLEGGSVRGSVLLAHLQWAHRHLGDTVAESICRRIDPEFARAIIRGVDDAAWYPFRALAEVDRAIADIDDRDAERVWRRLGFASSRTTLGGKRSKASTPHEFLERDALLQGNTIDFGGARYEAIADTAGRLTLTEWSCYTRSFCVSAEGYFEASVHQYGGTRPHVHQSACLCLGDETCVFEIDWLWTRPNSPAAG